MAKIKIHKLTDSQKKLLKIIDLQNKYLDTKDEIEADKSAIKIFLAMGHSVKEAEEVFIKVFKDKDRFKNVYKSVKPKNGN